MPSAPLAGYHRRHQADIPAFNGGGEGVVQKWLRPGELEHLPLGSTERKLAVVLAQRTPTAPVCESRDDLDLRIDSNTDSDRIGKDRNH